MVEAEKENKVEKKTSEGCETAEDNLAEQSLSFDWHVRRRGPGIRAPVRRSAEAGKR